MEHSLETPIEASILPERASRKRRIAAIAFDHMLISFLMPFSIFLFIGTNFTDNFSFIRFFLAFAVVFPLGFFLYTAKDCIGGTSPGKWLLGITIREADDLTKTPPFRKLFVRNLFNFIWPVEFFFMLTDSDKKRLADKQTNTLVVKAERKAPKALRIALPILVAGAMFTSLMFYIQSTTKNSTAYKMTIAHIESNEEVLSKTGGITGYGYFPGSNIRQTNGYGEAAFQIDVKGKEQDVAVYVYLTKSGFGGDWKIETFSLLDEE